MPGTVLRYLDSRPVSGPVLPNIAAHIFRWGGISRPTRIVWQVLCCDIWFLGPPGASFRSISQHTSSGGSG